MDIEAYEPDLDEVLERVVPAPLGLHHAPAPMPGTHEVRGPHAADLPVETYA
ncbi:hypothetical protein GCM10010124_27900 [Pilimelia terevasa]|uniref:Uncharacterized protein n=1 Tax=Pilimelia terevasa TaxID=53372 RepID=A0A8J3FIS7_9ACTN|nr:hypothetical protein [Pilimelia terevasa]GGK33732.1 hypothetical protein GCM10010124_27900 [Pilimelia terevasa]